MCRSDLQGNNPSKSPIILSTQRAFLFSSFFITFLKIYLGGKFFLIINPQGNLYTGGNEKNK